MSKPNPESPIDSLSVANNRKPYRDPLIQSLIVKFICDILRRRQIWRTSLHSWPHSPRRACIREPPMHLLPRGIPTFAIMHAPSQRNTCISFHPPSRRQSCISLLFGRQSRAAKFASSSFAICMRHPMRHVVTRPDKFIHQQPNPIFGIFHDCHISYEIKRK